MLSWSYWLSWSVAVIGDADLDESVALALDAIDEADPIPPAIDALRRRLMLAALIEKPRNVEGWNGPYLKKNVIRTDPWNNPYQYRSPGQFGDFDLWSLGADNREGGEGENRDVRSWE